jgi:hypothetical protein
MKYVSILAAVLVVCLAIPLAAQESKPADNMGIVRDAIRAEKKVLVADNMGLTEAEAKAFWPVYEEFQSAMKPVVDRKIALIQEYAANYETMTDEAAGKLLKDFMALQKDEVKLSDSFVPKFQKVLPAIKVARYFQIENKVRAVVDYDLAAQIPLVK